MTIELKPYQHLLVQVARSLVSLKQDFGFEPCEWKK